MALACGLALAAVPAGGQESSLGSLQDPAPAGAPAGDAPATPTQTLTDIDALIVATNVSMRCALYDASMRYLSPLSETAARVRIQELINALTPSVPDLATRLSRMRAEATDVNCGHSGLDPFLEFARQVADDITQIALRSWSAIDIERCSYFADTDFMHAVAHAKERAQTLPEVTDPDRRAYLEAAAQTWVTRFRNNCFNLSFDPTKTLPGRIALALPYVP